MNEGKKKNLTQSYKTYRRWVRQPTDTTVTIEIVHVSGGIETIDRER